MSIRFSRITAMTNNSMAIFLVGGAPSSQEDLDGWVAFDEFVKNMPTDEVITARVETFLYGEEDPVDATPEEIAYFYQRVNMRSDFIESRAQKIGETNLVLWLNK